MTAGTDVATDRRWTRDTLTCNAEPSLLRVDSRASMGFVCREWLSPHMIGFTLATTVAISGTYALLAGIGTYHADTPLLRLVYGVVCACVGWPICYSLNVVTLYVLRSRALVEVLVAFFFLGFFQAIPCASFVFLTETLIRSNHPASVGLLPLYATVATGAMTFNYLSLYVVYQRLKHAMACAISTEPSSAVTADHGVSEVGHNASPVVVRKEQETRRGGDDVSSSAPLMDLLPRELGGDIVYLKSEDHYVYVYTAIGSSLIRMRFRDAVAGLGEWGIQVHRSYWVAYRHMIQVKKRDRILELWLTDNHKVPVSSPYRGAVRASLAKVSE